MSSIIKQLPQEEIVKIAAGEVVERPASIIKECVENSIDALSTSITIAVKKGGIEEIIITDNGSGIYKNDVLLAFSPHATSKISSTQDLLSLHTYGFRGEALASIAAVSTVELSTRHIDEKEGSFLIIEQGHVATHTPLARAGHGTSIAIRHLFDAIPVRKKFLRSADTEWNALYHLVQNFAIAYPDIHFGLIRDGKEVFQLPATTKREERACQLWGEQVARQLLAILPQDAQEHEIKLEGLISGPHLWRHNRQQLMVFVNKRACKNRELGAAILRGYGDMLAHSTYPLGCIFLEIDGKKVDVNIHPRKEEVRFLHPGRVEHLLSHTVRTTLENYVKSKEKEHEEKNIMPAFPDRHTEKKLDDSQDNLKSKWNSFLVRPPTSQVYEDKKAPLSREEFAQIVLPLPPVPSKENDKETKIPLFHGPLEQEVLPFRLLGQVAKTFVLFEQDGSLFVIDQHAAHERILYERSIKKELPPSFPLAVPFSLHRSLFEPNEEKLMKILEEVGVSCEPFGPLTVAVRSLPLGMTSHDLEPLIREMKFSEEGIAQIEREEVVRKALHTLRALISCKAAVKAGDQLSEAEMRALIKDLSVCPNRHMCVHGRPTTWAIAHDELAKKFRRN